MKKNKKSIDTSPIVPQKGKLKNELHISSRELTEKQKHFLNIAMDKNTKMIFVKGPAGTAKTYTFVLAALQLLNQKRISDILYLRSNVESSDSKLGYLPGDTAEKICPYLQPLKDKLEELLSKADIDYLEKDGRINSIPIGFLRGLNWNAKCIIADEAQNMTVKELTTLTTRIGEFSKIYIIGDPEQSDIGSKSGFSRFAKLFDTEEDQKMGIYTFEFTEEDIVRSELVKYIVKKLKNL